MSYKENDLDNYYATGNANNPVQEKENVVIIKKRNASGWKLFLPSTAIVYT